MSTDNLCVSTIRCLSVDMITKAKSGHPGAPLGLAPAAHVLFSKFLNYEKDWINRDRFVLGPGHASALLYSMIHLYTRSITLDDIKNFRQFGSKCAGHPEHMLVPEIEATTGPLGQGLGYAVGMALSELHLAARFNKEGFPLFNHKVFAIISDGEMMEGVQAETASFAGHQKLDNLIAIYDDNHITIDGTTDITFTEDVQTRYKSYGWHTIEVQNADTNLEGIENAIKEALNHKGSPVLITIKTTLGFGSDVADTSKVHGNPLNEEQLANTKKFLGFNPDEKFVVPEEVYKVYDEVRNRAHQKAEAWRALFAEYEKKYPSEYAELQKIINPQFTVEEFKKFMPQDDDKTLATRMSSHYALNAVAKHVPGLIGGSADLAPCNNTDLDGEKVFQPNSREGRSIEFGIREHGMIGIANGIQFYGLPGLIPFDATFLTFIQYGLGAFRVACLENLRTLHIMTHDSIGLGEDGPTHQNVENFAMLRAMPNCVLFRPADYLETSACYTAAFVGKPRPAVFALSRQQAPPVPGVSFDGALKGGYVVKDAPDYKLILIGTGTELKLAYDAAEKLNVPVRVVSMPSVELFEEQSLEYRKSVLPGNVPTISVEAGVALGWQKYSHAHFGVERFGLSAPYKEIYEYFGLTPEKIAERAQTVLKFYETHPIPDLSSIPFP